jgi:hypothetical protein
MTWTQICRSDTFRGHWVALDNCRYDQTTASPVEGDVVDTDEDLAELCGRIRAADKSHCAILYCDEEVIVETPPPTSDRALRPRAAHH